MYDLKSWDGKNCLSLAYAIGQEKFMAHVSCQTLLAEIWTGYIKNSQHSQLKVRIDVKQNCVVISLFSHRLTLVLLMVNVIIWAMGT